MSDQSTVFELIDRIVCLDLGGRGIVPLYEPARARGTGPVCELAARHLAAAGRGDRVLILTGSLSRASVHPGIAENDGPMGAAAIARALSLGLNAVPVVFADEPILDKVAAMLRVAGLNVVSVEQAMRATSLPRFTAIAAMATVSADDAVARDESMRLVETLAPRAVLSIERAGLTADGTYRNALGEDYSEGRARLDHVMTAAQDRGVPTIGIGDGGNEIGMGAVRDAVRRHVPHGEVLCAELATAVLIPAGVSNWGAYGVAAALAVLLREPGLAHTADRERRMLEASPAIGLIDGSSGRLDPSADNMPMDVHLGICALLEQAVRRGCRS